MAVYFEKAGRHNTEETLRVAMEEAKRRGLGYVVVASTTGETGLLAARMAQGTGIKVVVVSHNVGFSEEGKDEFDPDLRREIEALGGKVLTGTMVLRGLGTAIRDMVGGSQQDIVANTLRMFGQGVKVCVEIVAMAADAGLIPFDDVIAVAGTGRGADTALLIRANSSNRFFKIKVREVLAKPRDF